jgi:hypothetical protein
MEDLIIFDPIVFGNIYQCGRPSQEVPTRTGVAPISAIPRIGRQHAGQPIAFTMMKASRFVAGTVSGPM